MALNTVINTNMMALTAHRNLGAVGNRQAKSNQRLSSGKKINSAADDAAGLAISEKMKAQIKGLDMAAKNSEDAISLIQTAEGSLTEVNNMLNRMRELSVQAANDTNQQEDRVKIAQEVAELMSEIDSISQRTEFNEKKLNDGSLNDAHFQIGANGSQNLNISIGNMGVDALGLDGLMDAFGIEGGSKDGSYITATVRKQDGSDVASTNQAAKAHSVESSQLNGNPLTNGDNYSFELTYRDSKGNIKTVKSKSVTAADNNNGKNIADAFQGIDIPEFKVEQGQDAKYVKFTAKEAGKDSKFDIIGLKAIKDDNTETSIAVAGGTVVQGDDAYTEYNLNTANDFKDGSSITVGGKTYTYRATGANIKDPKSEFSNKDELFALLEKEGIKVEKGATANYGKFMKINKGYMVSSDKVSDVGREYSESLKTIDKALKSVTEQRAKLGANQNRLEYTIKNLELSSENLNAARSRIEDTDMAKEMMNLTQANVLQQAATSILAQANQAPQSITQLLG